MIIDNESIWAIMGFLLGMGFTGIIWLIDNKLNQGEKKE
jgi:hypothetical protein